MRNVINGVTPDVIVVFGGSRGTLAEAAFAAAAGKSLFFYGGPEGGAVERLRRNFTTHFDAGGDGDIGTYLLEPLNEFPQAWRERLTPDKLRPLLVDVLAGAMDWTGTPADLVECCVEKARAKGPLGSTGFPGLPSDPSAKLHFEAEIDRISG